MKKDICYLELEMQETASMARSDHSVEIVIAAIGICGGSGSGKTTLARIFEQTVGPDKCCLLGQDSYYIDQSSVFDGDGGSVNFDHPSSIDFPLLVTHLIELKKGNAVDVPIYDFATHRRKKETVRLWPKPYILVDGTLILSQPALRTLLNTSIFLDIEEELRFQRRLDRDVKERGRQSDGVRKQFLAQVMPMHDLFVRPSKVWAGEVISDNNLNQVVVDKVVRSLK